MTKLSTSHEAMQEIVHELKQKTLEPAQEEARRIIREAEEEKARMLAEAEAEAKALHEEADQAIKQKKAIFESSLSQAGKQAIESVKQVLLTHLFSEELGRTLNKELEKPELIAQILQALVQAVEKEGVRADLRGILPKTADPKEVVKHLGKKTLEHLKQEKLVLGEFNGGAEVVAEDQHIRLVMDDQTIKELFTRFLHKDFRKWIFEE